MATVSEKLREFTSRFFCTYSNEGESYNGNDFFHNGKLDKFISVKSSSHNEVPVFCFETIVPYLRHEGNEVILPLTYTNGRVDKAYKTAHMLFHHLIKTPTVGQRLTRIRASSGETFYGANGILLDSNRNPIMLATIRTEGVLNINMEELILYINPKVFNSEGIINKYIKDKIIPHILSGIYLTGGSFIRGVNNRISNDSYGNYRGVTPKIVISDTINNFFTTVVDDGRDDASEIILHNLEDFFRCLDS